METFQRDSLCWPAGSQEGSSGSDPPHFMPTKNFNKDIAKSAKKKNKVFWYYSSTWMKMKVVIGDLVNRKGN